MLIMKRDHRSVKDTLERAWSLESRGRRWPQGLLRQAEGLQEVLHKV